MIVCVCELWARYKYYVNYYHVVRVCVLGLLSISIVCVCVLERDRELFRIPKVYI